MTADETQRRRNVRRTTLILVTVAMAFYLGFILLGVSRA
jgi:uncharacterized membrane protein